MTYTLAQLYTDATNVGAYRNIVAAGTTYVAVTVLKEDPATANHAARIAWAQKALADPPSMGEKMLWGVLSDPVINAALPAVSDAMVITSITALVNAYANA